jgi:hypothetical protein
MMRFFQPVARGRGSTTGGVDENNVQAEPSRIAALEQSNVGRPFNPDEIVVDPALRR